jgi:hypothetical protein
MIDPPTDRLHKFLAVGGLVLITLGVTYPLQKYDEAELHRIDAFDRTQRFGQAYTRYAEKVNEQIDLYNKVQGSDSDPRLIESAKKGILARQSEVAALERETSAAEADSSRNIQLMQHYYFMRNLWFCIGIFLVLVGTTASAFGFRQWLRQPKSTR